MLPLTGGSGGGGTGMKADGGAGGGAILIASSSLISITGSVLADGGNGALGNSGGLSGGGSGGGIRFIAPRIDGGGLVSANGGSATNAGSAGRIRLEAFEHEFTGTLAPSGIKASPGLIFPPSDYPTLKATTVAGVAVPDDPQDDFEAPDLEINSSGATSVVLEASYIPLGTMVQLRIISEEVSEQEVTSGPLAGTWASSTASALVDFPPGVSRVYLHAEWDLTKSEDKFLKEYPEDPVVRMETVSNPDPNSPSTLRYHLESGHTVEMPANGPQDQ